MHASATVAVAVVVVVAAVAVATVTVGVTTSDPVRRAHGASATCELLHLFLTSTRLVFTRRSGTSEKPMSYRLTDFFAKKPTARSAIGAQSVVFN